ncbi:MAG: hypothetical protein O2905_00170 [Proteobacteria bacterium]|nr:hypothetical protein [Pseudomonadota bacterium]
MIQNIRLLKAVVIVLGLGIVVGLGGLLVALGQRANDRASAATNDVPFTAAAGLERIRIPDGARVLEADLDGGRLLLRLRLANGAEEIAIHDLATGARLGAVAIAP